MLYGTAKFQALKCSKNSLLNLLNRLSFLKNLVSSLRISYQRVRPFSRAPPARHPSLSVNMLLRSRTLQPGITTMETSRRNICSIYFRSVWGRWTFKLDLELDMPYGSLLLSKQTTIWHNSCHRPFLSFLRWTIDHPFVAFMH